MAKAEQAMMTREQMDAEIDRIRRTPKPAAAPTTEAAPPAARTALAFRRREGRTIKLETAPEAPEPGVVFLIKGGQWTSERPIKLPQIPKEPPR